ELQGLMCPMLTMPYVENTMDAQIRMTPSEKPSSEIVCLVDDDPLALRSTGFKHVLIGTTAKQVMRRANRSVLVVPSHPGLRKMSNQKNGTRLMERLIPQTLSDVATRLVESLKMNSISEKVRRGTCSSSSSAIFIGWRIWPISIFAWRTFRFAFGARLNSGSVGRRAAFRCSMEIATAPSSPARGPF